MEKELETPHGIYSILTALPSLSLVIDFPLDIIVLFTDWKGETGLQIAFAATILGEILICAIGACGGGGKGSFEFF